MNPQDDKPEQAIEPERIKCKRIDHIQGTNCELWICPKCAGTYHNPNQVYCDCKTKTAYPAAEKYGRKWIGIDIRESQAKLSRKRISQQQEKMALFQESP